MKILHTADVHLSRDRPETLDALNQVITTATDLDIDLVTIGGDLFDTPADANALRAVVRDVFSGNSFDILAIPGNHDERVFDKNLRFGADIEILSETPYTAREYDSVQVLGVPFTSTLTEDLYTSLIEAGRTTTVQVLLLHCTLDIGFHSGEVGVDEGTYFPITQATLGEFDFEYVLAGHIHSTDREVPLANGAKFIYPGSPISHSISETGKRTAILLDTDEDAVSSVELDTFYHDSYSTMVSPGQEHRIFAEIDRWVAARRGDDCDLTVRVTGFHDLDENEFFTRLNRAAAPVEPIDETETVSLVLEHPVYRRFVEKLDERSDLEFPEHTREQFIDVMADLLARNEVQPP